MFLFTASILMALFVSSLCSVMEATLLSLTPAQLAEISTRKPGVGAIWQRFKSNIEQPISAILILNTAAHTIGAAVAGSQFNQIYGERWIWVFSLIFTYLMLQFTEILPKTLGVRFNRTIAVIMAHPLNVLIRLFRPVSFVIRLVNRPFIGKPKKNAGVVSLEDLAALAKLARMSELISPHQERIIKVASRLPHITAGQVMIPLSQVTYLSTRQSVEEAINTALRDPHTRFPICRDDDPDRVFGYVNFKELVAFHREHPGAREFQEVIRPVRFVPPGESADDLLAAFVDEHLHIAIVRNEQGQTLGLITLEDIVEELVGEIEDEFDRPPRRIHALAGGIWMLGGGVPVAEINTRLGLKLEGKPGENLSNWLIRHLGRVPDPGDVVAVDGAEFRVRRIRRGKVFEVSVYSPSK